MRQADRRARTSERLLDAAAEVFSRDGFHATTVDDVAAAAGYSKGAVYSNFAGKDALFLGVLDRHLDGQLAAIEQMASTTSAGRHANAAVDRVGRSGVRRADARVLALRGRNESARVALATHTADPRPARRADRGRRPGSRSPTDVATLALALDAGLFLQQLVDPNAVPRRVAGDGHHRRDRVGLTIADRRPPRSPAAAVSAVHVGQRAADPDDRRGAELRGACRRAVAALAADRPASGPTDCAGGGRTRSSGRLRRSGGGALARPRGGGIRRTACVCTPRRRRPPWSPTRPRGRPGRRRGYDGGRAPVRTCPRPPCRLPV